MSMNNEVRSDLIAFGSAMTAFAVLVISVVLNFRLSNDDNATPLMGLGDSIAVHQDPTEFDELFVSSHR